jgi:hypothetical protein
LDWEASCFSGKVVHPCSLRNFDLDLDIHFNRGELEKPDRPINRNRLDPLTEELQCLSQVEVSVQTVSRDAHGHLIVALARSYWRTMPWGVSLNWENSHSNYRFVVCDEIDFQRVCVELGRDWTRLLQVPICDDGTETFIDDECRLRRATPRDWEKAWQKPEPKLVDG